MTGPTTPPHTRNSIRGGLRHWFTASRIHYLSLVAAFGWLLICARGQWFFYDEWDFLKLSSTDFLTPHLGHWSTVPMLVTAATRTVFGLQSYWPFIIPVLLIHLGISHALWRLMLRLPVAPWIGTALSLLVALLGAGSENILWAFQLGFMGAILLGLVSVLLIDKITRDNYWRRFPLLAVTTVGSLMFSGTALPMLVAVGAVSLRRVGLWRSVLLLLPSVSVYGLWYYYVSSNPIYFLPAAGAIDSVEIVGRVLAFAGRMALGGFEALTPWPLLGCVIVGLLCIGWLARARHTITNALPALALAAAAGTFALLTAASRVGFSADTASSSRYIYTTTILLVPLVGVLCSSPTGVHRRRDIAVVASIALLTIYGGAVLKTAGESQSSTEQATHELFSATVALLDDPGRTLNISSHPDPNFAPSVTVGDIKSLVDAGLLKAGPYSQQSWQIADCRVTIREGELPSASDPRHDCPNRAEPALPVVSSRASEK
ncbi:hypothetical protein ITJ38_02800 [Agreia pratensis]|uniref:hypothetical protein n=1 Tax=Agreia pratensis TaxID=150121 RepID=UPI001889DFDB|nr:hypothetical protein [Agreia pratensis]MBF4633327.1 hypothetical protein [Agreia pratensis]